MPSFEKTGPPTTDDTDVRAFSPPSCAAENLTCQLLIAGGGLSGLSAAEAAMARGLDVIVIEKGVFGKEAASGLNAGQFLTGWVKPVETMLSELARQEQEQGLRGEQARLKAQRRVRAFLRRTIEGCQRLAALNHDYNLRASVRHGAAIAAMTDADLADLNAVHSGQFVSNFLYDATLMRAAKPTSVGRPSLAGDPDAAAEAGPGAPHRPWRPVRRHGVSRRAASRRPAAEHEPRRQLLRQCVHGKLFWNLQDGDGNGRV
jgi:voltage-gated potassium channel Kch